MTGWSEENLPILLTVNARWNDGVSCYHLSFTQLWAWASTKSKTLTLSHLSMPIRHSRSYPCASDCNLFNMALQLTTTHTRTQGCVVNYDHCPFSLFRHSPTTQWHYMIYIAHNLLLPLHMVTYVMHYEAWSILLHTVVALPLRQPNRYKPFLHMRWPWWGTASDTETWYINGVLRQCAGWTEAVHIS